MTPIPPRPHEALTLLADGCTLAEIAERMITTRSTVSQNLRRARERLCAATNAHAVAIALKRGLIT